MLPQPLRIGLTFAIVCVTWVFFRSDSLGHAGSYLASMFGVSEPATTAHLVSGVIHQRLPWSVMILSAVVVWGTRSSWSFVQHTTLVKACWCLMILLLAMMMLATQSYNPFIYFIF